MILTLIIFLVILGATIFIHELGHFIFARVVGVHVYEFSIGMGPKLFSIKGKKTDTKYSIRAIPLGGYVQLAGEEVDLDLKKYKGKNLQDKTVFQRFLVMFMGVGFNLIFALAIMFFIGLIYGSPSLDPVIESVTNNYPAQEAGITAGDKILEINDKKVKYSDDVMLYITVADLEKPISITVLKENETVKNYTFKALKKVDADKATTYHIGIVLNNDIHKGIIPAIKYSYQQERALIKQIYVVLGNLFTGGVSVKQLSGPVGIYSVVGDMQKSGISALLYLTALLSINVGIMNLLPFPAFDGGRIVFLFIEKIKGSPVNPKVENIIHSIGFVLLILLMIYVTMNDILKLF